MSPVGTLRSTPLISIIKTSILHVEAISWREISSWIACVVMTLCKNALVGTVTHDVHQRITNETTHRGLKALGFERVILERVIGIIFAMGARIVRKRP